MLWFIGTTSGAGVTLNNLNRPQAIQPGTEKLVHVVTGRNKQIVSAGIDNPYREDGVKWLKNRKCTSAMPVATS